MGMRMRPRNPLHFAQQSLVVEPSGRRTPIPRPPFVARPPTPTGPRTNRQIRVPEVRVLDAEGQQIGVMPTEEAIRRAEEAGLDLIEVAATAEPPVCRIADLGQIQVRAGQAGPRRQEEPARLGGQGSAAFGRAPTTTICRCGCRAARRFLEEGHKVKVEVRFRGREATHPEVARDQIGRIAAGVADIAIVERSPSMEGRAMFAILARGRAGAQPGQAAAPRRGGRTRPSAPGRTRARTRAPQRGRRPRRSRAPAARRRLREQPHASRAPAAPAAAAPAPATATAAATRTLATAPAPPGTGASARAAPATAAPAPTARRRRHLDSRATACPGADAAPHRRQGPRRRQPRAEPPPTPPRSPAPRADATVSLTRVKRAGSAATRVAGGMAHYAGWRVPLLRCLLRRDGTQALRSAHASQGRTSL